MAGESGQNVRRVPPVDWHPGNWRHSQDSPWSWPAKPGRTRGALHRHSARSVTMGSRYAARRAGSHAATRVETRSNATAAT